MKYWFPICASGIVFIGGLSILSDAAETSEYFFGGMFTGMGAGLCAAYIQKELKEN